MEDHSLDSFFRKRFARELGERDEEVRAIWYRVRPQISAALGNFGVAKIPKVSSSAFKEIDMIISASVPQLRKKAATRLGKKTQ
jgi:hypothetical protein